MPQLVQIKVLDAELLFTAHQEVIDRVRVALEYISLIADLLNDKRGDPDRPGTVLGLRQILGHPFVVFILNHDLMDIHMGVAEVVKRKTTDFRSPETEQRQQERDFIPSPGSLLNDPSDILIRRNIDSGALLFWESGVDHELWPVHPHDRVYKAMAVERGLWRMRFAVVGDLLLDILAGDVVDQEAGKAVRNITPDRFVAPERGRAQDALFSLTVALGSSLEGHALPVFRLSVDFIRKSQKGLLLGRIVIEDDSVLFSFTHLPDAVAAG